MKVKKWTWDEIDSKVAGLADGTEAYWKTAADEDEEHLDHLHDMVNNWGLYDAWGRVWDLACSIVGIQYTYQQGYYWFYLGRYAGITIANGVILAEWYYLFEALQPKRSKAFADYTEAWIEHRDAKTAEEDGHDKDHEEADSHDESEDK